MTWIENVELLEKTQNWGRLKASDFAADLWAVSHGKSAPKIYKKPENFFKVTHVTEGLREFMLNILRRVSGEADSDSVIELQSSFGGGKSHSLMACYHTLSSPDDAKPFLTQLGWSRDIPETKIAIFDGFGFNPVDGIALKHDESVKYTTPWGLIFAQLGGTAAVNKLEDKGKSLRPPTREKIKEILNDAGPSVILIDEVVFSTDVLQAVAGQKDKLQPNQVANFLQVLSVAVSQTNNCMLIYTIPEKESEYGKIETSQLFQQMRTQIRDRLQRVGTPRLTLSDQDIYGVIRKRIFDEIKVPDELIKKYIEMYQESEFPDNVKSAGYRDSMEKAYPFHPELIKTIQEHLAIRPAFQKTRDVLRLLTYIVRALEEMNVDDDLILLGDIPLDNSTIREFLIRLDLGNLVEPLDTDITRTDSRVNLIDQNSQLKVPLAKKLASSIFLKSLSSVNVSMHGSNLADLLVATRSLNLSNNEIESTLEKITSIKDGCYYLHIEDPKGLPRYLFKEQRTLANLLHEARENIKDSKVTAILNRVLNDIKGNTRVKCIINIKTPSIDKIPDDDSTLSQNPQLRLIFPGFHLTTGTSVSDNVSETVKTIINNSSAGQNPQPRKYRNSLAVVIADQNYYQKAFDTAKNILASDTVRATSIEQLTRSDQERLDELSTRWKSQLNEQVLFCFSHIFFPGKKDKISHLTLGAASFTNRKSLADRIWDYLIQEDYVATKVRAERLVDASRTYWNMGPDGNAVSIMSLSDIWLAMCRDASVPRLAYFESLWDSIEDVIKKNLAILVKISSPKNANELKIDKIISDIPRGGSFSNYYLIKPDTDYLLKCNECEEWKPHNTILDHRCYDCQEIACPNCQNSIIRKELYGDGTCKYCRGKVRCENCDSLVDEEDLRGDECTRCQGQKLCPRCNSPQDPDDITKDGCPNCKGKEQCIICKKFRLDVEDGICKLCKKPDIPDKPDEPIKENKCLKCGKVTDTLTNGICYTCSAIRHYRGEITKDYSDLADLLTYVFDNLSKLDKTKGSIKITFDLETDENTSEEDHNTINTIKESIQQMGGDFSEK